MVSEKPPTSPIASCSPRRPRDGSRPASVAPRPLPASSSAVKIEPDRAARRDAPPWPARGRRSAPWRRSPSCPPRRGPRRSRRRSRRRTAACSSRRRWRGPRRGGRGSAAAAGIRSTPSGAQCATSDVRRARTRTARTRCRPRRATWRRARRRSARPDPAADRSSWCRSGSGRDTARRPRPRARSWSQARSSGQSSTRRLGEWAASCPVRVDDPGWSGVSACSRTRSRSSSARR